jgi:hypothetical protein
MQRDPLTGLGLDDRPNIKIDATVETQPRIIHAVHSSG